MGTKTTSAHLNPHTPLGCEKRIPKHGDENLARSSIPVNSSDPSEKRIPKHGDENMMASNCFFSSATSVKKESPNMGTKTGTLSPTE